MDIEVCAFGNQDSVKKKNILILNKSSDCPASQHLIFQTDSKFSDNFLIFKADEVENFGDMRNIDQVSSGAKFILLGNQHSLLRASFPIQN